MKDKLMNVLFSEWSDSHEDSPEYSKAANMMSANGKADRQYEALTDSVIAESKLAFTAGFNAAVALLMGGAN